MLTRPRPARSPLIIDPVPSTLHHYAPGGWLR